MFLELHLYESNKKIMLNINKIKSIYQEKEATFVYIGRHIYRVKESYEDILNAINNWDRLTKA